MQLKPEKSEWDDSLFGKTYRKNEERCPIAFSLSYSRKFKKKNHICNFSRLCDRHDKGKFMECGIGESKAKKSH